MRILTLLFILLASCSQPDISCGDLLEKYGEKPSHLTFISCDKSTGQTILEAKYAVDGAHAQEVENFLIENYGMDSLHFVCCGWESINGQNGQINNAELTKINPNYIIDISMFGNAEEQLDNDSTTIELDRTNIDFDVIVRMLNV